MAGKFEITKHGDGTFTFELLIDEVSVGSSPVFEKEDACKRGVKAVKKNSRMKVQNNIAGDEEKTNPKYVVDNDGDKACYTLFLQTGAADGIDAGQLSPIIAAGAPFQCVQVHRIGDAEILKRAEQLAVNGLRQTDLRRNAVTEIGQDTLAVHALRGGGQAQQYLRLIVG